MRRREFVAGVGAAAAWPVVARAQQPATPVIGYLSGRSHDTEAGFREPLLKALEQAGFVPGRNVTIEYRYTDGRDEQLPAAAADLVRRKVTVLVATAQPAGVAAKSATATIPLVFSSGNDPVGAGLVTSLNQPGGNATGVSVFTTQLGPKRLGLLREFLPKPGLIAFMISPNSASTPGQLDEMEAAAKALSQPLLVLNASTEQEAEAAFAIMAQRKVSAVLYAASQLFQVIDRRLVALAARYRIPASYEWRDTVAAGGLMSYGTDRGEIGRQMGNYAAQILKGIKPADLPVVQSSNFVFVLNVVTARSLGMEVPPMLLARADEVIG